MYELLQVAVSPVNIVYTTLLILVLLYWCTVLIGLLDFSSFDLDLDLDADVDVDADIDVDADADIDSGGFIIGALQFFHFGKMPFMIIMSFVILFAWVLNIYANFYLGKGEIGFALAMAIPLLFVSLILTKIITMPLLPVFKGMNEGEEKIDMIGLTCKVLSNITPNKLGQGELTYNHSVLKINIIAEESTPQINRNTEAIIIDQTDKYYIVKPI